MDKTIKIAGNLTVDDWLDLKIKLEANIKDTQLWEDAWQFFYKRVRLS